MISDLYYPEWIVVAQIMKLEKQVQTVSGYITNKSGEAWPDLPSFKFDFFPSRITVS